MKKKTLGDLTQRSYVGIYSDRKMNLIEQMIVKFGRRPFTYLPAAGVGSAIFYLADKLPNVDDVERIVLGLFASAGSALLNRLVLEAGFHEACYLRREKRYQELIGKMNESYQQGNSKKAKRYLEKAKRYFHPNI